MITTLRDIEKYPDREILSQYKGQQFKRRKLRKEKGVTRKLAKAGADLVNSGSFVSKAENPKKALKLLEEKFDER